MTTSIRKFFHLHSWSFHPLFYPWSTEAMYCNSVASSDIWRLDFSAECSLLQVKFPQLFHQFLPRCCFEGLHHSDRSFSGHLRLLKVWIPDMNSLLSLKRYLLCRYREGKRCCHLILPSMTSHLKSALIHWEPWVYRLSEVAVKTELIGFIRTTPYNTGAEISGLPVKQLFIKIGILTLAEKNLWWTTSLNHTN